MEQSHAKHLQQDLETLRSVVGIDLPFDKTDAKFTVAVGLSALAPAIVGWMGVRSPVVLIASCATFLILVASNLIRGYRSAHPSKPCPASRRCEYRTSIWYSLALVPMFGGYHWWAASLDIPTATTNGTITMFLGVLIAIGAIYEANGSAGWCVAIPADICGLLWPHLEYFQFWAVLWSLVGFGTIAAGMLLQRQLRGQHVTLASEGP